MRAWAHFALSECAPLYAVQLAFTSYVISKELESNFGGIGWEDCRMNSEYARCASARADARLARGAVRVREARVQAVRAHGVPAERLEPRLGRERGVRPAVRLVRRSDDATGPGAVRRGLLRPGTGRYRYEACRSDAYPPRNTDYIPHESLFFNWFAFSCTLVMFCVANALFLTRVGPRAKLDGRYVRILPPARARALSTEG